MDHYIKDYKDRDKPYLLIRDIRHYTQRNRKSITVKAGTRSDGATGAYDLNSKSWWFHDELCKTGLFDDGTRCTNWQASKVLYEVLKQEGKWFRARTWRIATFFFGGGEARDNGMFNL